MRRGIWWPGICVGITVIAIQLIGWYISSLGQPWYDTLILPSFTPPKWMFSVVWPVLYICAGLSAIIAWEYTRRRRIWYTIMSLFAVNAGVNLLWSFTFFYLHALAAAVVVAVLLELSILSLMVSLYAHVRRSAVLLIPYALWVGYAIALSYGVYSLNT